VRPGLRGIPAKRVNGSPEGAKSRGFSLLSIGIAKLIKRLRKE
jgi:hypothetical protein